MELSTRLKTGIIEMGILALLGGCEPERPAKGSAEIGHDVTVYIPADCVNVRSESDSRRGFSLLCEDDHGKLIIYKKDSIDSPDKWVRYVLKRANKQSSNLLILSYRSLKT